MKRKVYIKPEVEKIAIDNSISLQMASTDAPVGGDGSGFKPRGGGDNNKPSSDPFASPFGDKPFK
jgi:hypothetical protein